MAKDSPTHFGVSFMPPVNTPAYLTYIDMRGSHRKHNRTENATDRNTPCPNPRISVQMEAQTTCPDRSAKEQHPVAYVPETERTGHRPNPTDPKIDRSQDRIPLPLRILCHNHSISAQKSQAPPDLSLFRLVGKSGAKGRIFPFGQSSVFSPSSPLQNPLIFRNLKLSHKVNSFYSIQGKRNGKILFLRHLYTVFHSHFWLLYLCLYFL